MHLTSIKHIRFHLCLGLLLILGSPFTLAQKLSPTEAAASARSFAGGKVLKVKAMKGEKVDYRVKVLSPEGRVRNIIVDGNSGEVRTRRQSRNPGGQQPSNSVMKGFR